MDNGKEKNKEKNKRKLRAMWDTIMYINADVVGVPKGKEREKEQKII